MSADVFARYPPPLRIVCPLCGARPAQPCQSRRRRVTEPHVARVTAAERHDNGYPDTAHAAYRERIRKGHKP